MKPATIKKIAKTTLFLLILSTVYHLSPKVSFAQIDNGLSVAYPRLEGIIVEPGGVSTKEIKVRNESKELKTIDVYYRDFVVNDNKGTPTFLDDIDNNNNRWAASSWLQASESHFSLKPGETKSLWLTIMPPVNALPGGHYAGVFYQPNSNGTLNSTGVSIQMDVGTLVYITIPGEITQKASIQSFSAPKFSEFGPIDFKTTIKNSSDIHIKPKGAITVNNWFNKEIGKLQITETNIFPNITRDFSNILDKRWLFGRYKANFQAYYGTVNEPISATLFFWVIPWRLIILIASAIAIIVTLIIISKNKPKKNTNESTTQVAELEKELEILKKKYQDQ
jgi:hypothetical protein